MKEIKKRVTLVDIASATGFSVNCVSRALMDANDISSQTKEIIRKKADELGYIPNMNAASLKNGNSKIIGILYDNLLNPYYGTIIHYLEIELKKRGYSFITFISPKFNLNVYRDIVARNVEGLITFLAPESDLLAKMRFELCPIVLLGRKSKYVTSICYDDIKIGELAAQTLYDKECRNLVYLGETDELDISVLRSEGFKDKLQKLNINPKLYFKKWDDKISEIVEQVLNQQVDGIFCFCDLLAFNVINELNKYKVNNVKIIGVDNIQEEIPFAFNLTTIGPDKIEISKKTIELLFNQIEKKDYSIKFYIENVRLFDNF